MGKKDTPAVGGITYAPDYKSQVTRFPDMAAHAARMERGDELAKVIAERDANKQLADAARALADALGERPPRPGDMGRMKLIRDATEALCALRRKEKGQ